MNLSQQIDTIELKHGEWKAVIIPDYGMNMVSLTYNGEQILREPKNIEEFLKLPETYGTPPLLPANRTRDGLFVFLGKQYRLPINDKKYHTHKHGVLHISSFNLLQKTKDYVAGLYESKGDKYPFFFKMEISCSLKEWGCFQCYRLTNIGKEPMPVIFAIHASFKKPEQCLIPLGEEWEADENGIPTGRLRPLPKVLRPYVNGKVLTSKPVGFCCTSIGHKAQIGSYIFEVSENFHEWVIWNGSGNDDFLCVEPQTSPSNALNMPGQALCLGIDETICFWTSISRIVN